MRRWLLDAPAWVLGLINGAIFATLGTLWFSLGAGVSWPEALGTWVLGGAFVGFFTGRLQYRRNRETRQRVGDAAGEDLRRVLRGTWRGPVPEDPVARQRAYDLVIYQEDQLRSQRTWALPLFVLMVALAVWLALSGSAWWWLAAGLFTLMLALQVLLPARLRHRADLLRGVGQG